MTNDQQQLAALIQRLFAALDDARFTDLTGLLADTATVRTPGGETAGRDAVIAQASRNHRPEWRIQHLVHNPLIEIDGDRARIRADLVAVFVTAGAADRLAPQPTFELGERYRFEAVRRPEGWRLTRIESTPVWSRGERPAG